MKKKLFIILIALLVLISLLVLTLYLSLSNKTSNSKSGSLDNIKYYNINFDIEKIEVKNDSGNFSLTKNDDDFSIDKLNSIPLNKNFCSSLFNNSKELSVMKSFEYSNKNEDFGFYPPKVTIDVYGKSDKKTLIVGNLNPDKTGYYVFLNDSDKIGVISSSKATTFLRKVEDYALLNSFFPYSTKQYDDNGDYLDGGIKNCSIYRKNLNDKINLSINEKGKLNIVSPSNYTIDEESENQIENAPLSLSCESLYSYYLNDSIISSCGLDYPYSIIQFSDLNSTHTIKIGNHASQTQYYHNENNETNYDDTVSSSYYIMIDDIPSIYIANESYLPWLSINFSSWFPLIS